MADAEVDYNRVWQDTIHHLDGQGVAQRQRAFLVLSRLVGVLQNLAIIVTPNPMTKGVIEDQIGSAVREALTEQLGVEIVQLSVEPAVRIQARRRFVEEDHERLALA